MFSSRRTKLSASSVANGSAASAATRSRARPAGGTGIDLGGAESHPGPRHDDQAAARTGRAQQLAATAASAPWPETKNGTSEPTSAASADQVAERERLGQRRVGEPSAAAGSALRLRGRAHRHVLSMCTRHPAPWPVPAAEQAESTRGERVAAGQPGRLDASRRSRFQLQAVTEREAASTARRRVAVRASGPRAG